MYYNEKMYRKFIYFKSSIVVKIMGISNEPKYFSCLLYIFGGRRARDNITELGPSQELNQSQPICTEIIINSPVNIFWDTFLNRSKYRNKKDHFPYKKVLTYLCSMFNVACYFVNLLQIKY